MEEVGEGGEAHVVEVLARPDFVCQVVGMHICQRVLLQVPAAKTQIQPAREGDLMVNDDHFLVVRLRGSANWQRGVYVSSHTQ